MSERAKIETLRDAYERLACALDAVIVHAPSAYHLIADRDAARQGADACRQVLRTMPLPC